MEQEKEHQNQADDAAEEESGAKVALSPLRQSKSEREKHEVTHVPYRS
jgi:hypothetical protein